MTLEHSTEVDGFKVWKEEEGILKGLALSNKKILGKNDSLQAAIEEKLRKGDVWDDPVVGKGLIAVRHGETKTFVKGHPNRWEVYNPYNNIWEHAKNSIVNVMFELAQEAANRAKSGRVQVVDDGFLEGFRNPLYED